MQDSSVFEDSSAQDSSVFEDSSVQDSSTTQKPDDVSPPIDYDGITKAEFYANYTVAVSSEDAKKRSEYGLMSGSLQTPDQAPEIADNRPMSGDLYLRNSQMLYSEDNQAYTVLYLSGEVAFTVYYGGAYITLEEVAAYVYAFGEIPANYTSKKSGSSVSKSSSSQSTSPVTGSSSNNRKSYSGSYTSYDDGYEDVYEEDYPGIKITGKFDEYSVKLFFGKNRELFGGNKIAQRFIEDNNIVINEIMRKDKETIINIFEGDNFYEDNEIT